MPYETTVYKYLNQSTLTWSGTESTTGSFRKEIDWGDQNMRNRIGIYLISDPDNDYNVRFFLVPRSDMPGGPTGAVNLIEPVVEEVDNNNRARRMFYIGPGDKLYAEPAAYASPLTTPIKLYVYQVVGVPVKYFGL